MPCHIDSTFSCHSCPWRACPVSRHRIQEHRCRSGKSTDKAFHNLDFNITIFRENHRNISDCRKVISNGFYAVFRNRVLEQVKIKTKWSDRSRERTSIYLSDPLEVLQKHVYVMDKTEDFVFRHMDKKLRADGNAFQCSHMQEKSLGAFRKAWNIWCSPARTKMLSGPTLNL